MGIATQCPVAAAIARLQPSDSHLARYELALEATRRPELRTVLVASGEAIRGMVAERFAGNRDLAGSGLRATIRALLTAVTSPGS